MTENEQDNLNQEINPNVEYDYVTIHKGLIIEHGLFIGKWENGVYTPMNRKELEHFARQHTFDPTQKHRDVLVKRPSEW